MDILHAGVAGTLESGDIMVTVEPHEKGGISIDLTSPVMAQYGRHIRSQIQKALDTAGVTDANVTAVDKGALDCTIFARTSAAVLRAAQVDDYGWEVKR